MANHQTIQRDGYDRHIIPAEIAARRDREGDNYKQLPTSDAQGRASIDTTAGYTVDGRGLANNYAIEPEMYIEEPGDLRPQNSMNIPANHTESHTMSSTTSNTANATANQIENPTVSDRHQYQEKVQAELQKVDAKIDEVVAKAKHAEADAKVTYHNKLEELRSARDAAAQKLEALENSTDEAWDNLRQGFENAWDQLTQSFDRAVKSFESV
jgi:molecular chaperone GrpE (heat shock protein)